MGETPRTQTPRAEAYLHRVRPLAREYRHLGVPLEDLEAEGTLGLLEAVARYDASRGVRFLSYASWWIRKRIVEAISRQSLLVRLPRGALQRLRRVRQAEHDLRALLGRPPSCEEIARATGLPQRDVDLVLLSARREISLDGPAGHEGTRSLEDVLADPREGGPELALTRLAGRVHVQALLRDLPARQRTVLVLRFGLEGNTECTLSAIGRRLGVTRERVRQLEKNGLALLRRSLAEADSPRSGRTTRSVLTR